MTDDELVEHLLLAVKKNKEEGRHFKSLMDIIRLDPDEENVLGKIKIGMSNGETLEEIFA